MFYSKEIIHRNKECQTFIYYWEKLAFSKLVGKVNFLERKFEEMH